MKSIELTNTNTFNDGKSMPPQYYSVCNFLSGGTANAISRTLVAPLERIRLSMQVDSNKYQSTYQCTKHILQNEGITGFYRGNWLNVLRIFPQGI